jgi:hypothetical protein
MREATVRQVDSLSTTVKLALVAVLVFVIAIAGVVVGQHAFGVSIDYRLTVYAVANPDEPCRTVEIDNPNIIRGIYPDCPGGQKIASMLEGDRVFLEGKPLPDDVYTVHRVTFTELGERPVMGDAIRAALFASYGGSRYWVLLTR